MMCKWFIYTQNACTATMCSDRNYDWLSPVLNLNRISCCMLRKAKTDLFSQSYNCRSGLLLLVLGLTFFALGGCGRGGLERLLKIGDDIVNVFRAHRDPNEILQKADVSEIALPKPSSNPGSTYLSCARAGLLLVRELFVCRGPRVDSERLGVAHVGQVRDELEPVHDLAAGLAAALYAEAEDAA